LNLPLRVLRIRVIDWPLKDNYASFIDIDRAVAKHIERIDHIVYSPASQKLRAIRLRHNFTMYPTRSHSKLHFFRDACRLAVKLHRRHRYHLIYTDDPMWSGLVGYLLKRLFKRPLLVMVHSDYYSNNAWRQENPRYYLDYLLSLWIIRKADWIKAVSHQIAKELVRLGAAPGRITILPTLIRTGLFRMPIRALKPSQTDRFLFVGRLEKQKGLPFLLRAVADLVASGNPVYLTIAGEGSLRPKIENIICRLGIQANVRLLGRQSHHQLQDIYRSHRFLILPSLHEGTPKAIVEAGLCGIPTIGTNVGGIPELVVSGETGLLVPPRNVPALAKAIKILLDAPHLARVMGRRAAKQYRDQFDFPVILSKLLSLYAAAALQTSKP